MADWFAWPESAEGRITCDDCGRVYDLFVTKVPFRDRDSVECRCGKTLKSWNSSHTYSIRLVEDK